MAGFFRRLAGLLALETIALLVSRANVVPNPLFSDHLVLQQGRAVPIWGNADPGESIRVTFGEQTITATADAAGLWRVNLANLAPGGPYLLQMSGGNGEAPLIVRDVLVGEVWLASGQSNMDFSISKKVKYFAGVRDEDREIAAADYPQMRMYTGPVRRTLTPQPTIQAQWLVCSPATVPAFSAVGYFFARDVQREIHQPVGIVTMTYGASTAEAWVRREALAANPLLRPLLERFDIANGAFETSHPDRAHYAAEFAAAQAAGASASPPGPGGGAGKRPRLRNLDPVQDQHNPTVLFNGMVNPIIPFAIRGVIWYQGESIVGGDAGRRLYPVVQTTLIEDWRRLWGEGDIPFYIVQLAGQEADSNNPWIREAQASALSLPNTGMAVAIDIGEAHNVHPKNKQDVGDRLARIALAEVYDRKVEFSGPVYRDMSVEPGVIRIAFAHVGGGLVAKGGPLKWFSIAGADRRFVAADARIDGDTILVSAAAVPAPVAVRYAWVNFPDGANFFNAAGLPAPPFRTDSWPAGGIAAAAPPIFSPAQ